MAETTMAETKTNEPSEADPSSEGHQTKSFPAHDDQERDVDSNNDSFNDDGDEDEDEHDNEIGIDMDSGEHKGNHPQGGFDTTPLPDAPQGYTVRFTFHSAKDLPVADFHTGSADPYIIATLKGTQPKRHKEDPDLTYRTTTKRRTLEPVWDEEWTVSNVPLTGFSLKCRMYDEDGADKDDRLGNVTVTVDQFSPDWQGIPPPGKTFSAKKRVMSKRAYLLKGLSNALHGGHITPKLCISVQLLGRSNPPFAQMCTLGPTAWIKHYSPMIGRLIGTKVNADELDDEMGDEKAEGNKSQKYDFQANQVQLQGPVPTTLYHRYVEFRPIIGSLFASTGIRGTILNKALHKQHRRIYNFDSTTERGLFTACSEEASLQFLRMAHFDEGGRIFTYVLTLDGLFRFTETGKEFGIDMLSKHTMHADAEKYIACSGEFFIRKKQRHHDHRETHEHEHKQNPGTEGKNHPVPENYQLFIDNESGTYRPDKSILPDLGAFLQKNFPGLGIMTMSVEDERLQDYKEEQRSTKKREGRMMHVVMNSSSSSSLSSIESELDERDETWELGRKSKKEAAYAAMMNPDKEHVKAVLRPK